MNFCRQYAGRGFAAKKAGRGLLPPRKLGEVAAKMLGEVLPPRKLGEVAAKNAGRGVLPPRKLGEVAAKVLGEVCRQELRGYHQRAGQGLPPTSKAGCRQSLSVDCPQGAGRGLPPSCWERFYTTKKAGRGPYADA